MRLRTIAALGLAGVGGAFVVDRWIGDLVARGEGPDPVMKMAITIRAPIDDVWDVVADIERQPLWMEEMKAVRLTTPGPVGVGTRGDADVRIFLVGDRRRRRGRRLRPAHPVRHPPRGDVHRRRAGSRSRRSTAARTLVRWDERLVPPLFPHLGQLLQKPIMGAIFQADLERLREIVESQHAEAMARRRRGRRLTRSPAGRCASTSSTRRTSSSGRYHAPRPAVRGRDGMPLTAVAGLVGDAPGAAPGRGRHARRPAPTTG